METVTLGSSNGAIEVEAVGLDKIRSNLANLKRIRHVTVDTNVRSGDPYGKIRHTCPNVVNLDLSDSLLPSWEDVSAITCELPKLTSLTLNRNRFSRLSAVSQTMMVAFVYLQDLRLNRTLISWEDTHLLLECMPELRSLELAYNRLRLCGDTENHRGISMSKLELLNFEGNDLDDWRRIMAAFSPFTNLRRVILASNMISAIPMPSQLEPNRYITHVGLSSNQVNSWSVLDALHAWLPHLESLTINDNPLVDGHGSFRQLVIARIPSLLSLNATAISVKERTDCELFYLSQISQEERSEEIRDLSHPRWMELCEKYGRPHDRHGGPQDTLAKRLISIKVRRTDTEPQRTTTSQLTMPQLTVRVLPTMSFRAFQLKLLKSLHETPRRRPECQIWLLTENGEILKLEGDDTRDLTWFGVEDGTGLLVYLSSQ
ncbi:RNI-like protein [Rickenella mellea]|uniref:RNI-like protein n=1 Tax=Rickenella mellea TaxID=50990 RepID=A0A4Y7QBF5_9AGAM|nr:RNI-like protein [Rickenella mellea]